MEDTAQRAVAIVGVGAILPDAPDANTFWENIKQGRYSITDVSPERWDPALYYDADPAAPDKTYSKIGGWVRAFDWEPMKWHLPIPPRVGEAMDDAQKWAVACTRAALLDYGYPGRPLDGERTAVILGSAIAGERQYLTALRAYFPEFACELRSSESFAAVPAELRARLADELQTRVRRRFPEITEDTMPGELGNCLAGRVANLFNFRGPNYVTDAACASAMAALSAAVDGLAAREFDVAITGGIDRNMGPSTYIKFCKIGALSGTGTRPYAAGADGFVMGEGAAIFVLKRLADAERDGDRICAVIRGIAGSSDGKGKGITAPNPAGQKLSVERAWRDAGVSPASVTLVEGHGTSTRVGDVVEVQSMAEVLSGLGLPAGSVALGSVKSNIGHLKAAAGAAGVLKTALALRDKLLPPSVNCERRNPDIDFAHCPLAVNTELRPWPAPADFPRRAGVSAFGFGGTNFHAVLEEYLPGRLGGNGKRSVAVSAPATAAATNGRANGMFRNHDLGTALKPPLRGALLLGASSEAQLVERLRAVMEDAQSGRAPAPAPPAEPDLRAPQRLAIDYADPADLADKCGRALKACSQPAAWKALRAKGIFRGRGAAPKVCFLYTGQGSQYVNMLQPLRAAEALVADTFAEADRVLAPLLGKPLSEFIFVDKTDPSALADAEEALRQTAVTQPAVLSADMALTRLLMAYGIQPDMTMGHSLGEYGALIAAGALPFGDALEAVSARGREMARVSVADNGRMAAVFAPLAEIEQVVNSAAGYVVIANINSNGQSVIGGATDAVEQAMRKFQQAGHHVMALPVSHAFHTSIVAPASQPLRHVLERMHLQPPRVPVIANVTGEFYPADEHAVPKMIDLLAQQVASPVQFVKGLNTLYGAGARLFVECGPKRALQGFVEDVFAGRDDVASLSTNHPRNDIAAFNQALCGLYAAGLGRGRAETREQPIVVTATAPPPAAMPAPAAHLAPPPAPPLPAAGTDRYTALGRLLAEFLDRASDVYRGQAAPGGPAGEPVVITGAALGLPGTDHIFDDANVARILRGDQFIDAIPPRFRQAMLDKHITRLVKSGNGGPTFEPIQDVDDVIKLAGRGRAFDLEVEFGVPAERIPALDRATCLAMAAGIDALRDAGIPLVMRYKTTSKGTQLPDRWALPASMRDDTGIVFACAFPGYDAFTQQLSDYFADRARREQLAALEALRAQAASNGADPLRRELERRIGELRARIEREPYLFDRRFLFRVLSMGHSQFAEYIGARGPNTAVNAACSSTTQAVTIAEDWIRLRRCRRVIVISADDVTSDHMLEWFAAGFLASGAAATDERVEDAAIPFDRRRHGMLIGMGAAALVLESAEAARERGLRPICEVLGSVTLNSAHHGTRLDIKHISDVMEDVVAGAERRHGIRRQDIAGRMVFVSHETYTPARGGSASAEIHALRRVFGDDAGRIVIANTKGFTGHPMGTGIEDVVAVKTLETGVVPPVANFREVDPELGALNLSKGGPYPVEYALRLAAGFGSQISMTLLRWVPSPDRVRPAPPALGYGSRVADPAAWNGWLARISGRPAAQLETVLRTLRVHDPGAPARVAEPAREARPAPAPLAPVLQPEPVKVAPPPAPAAAAQPAVAGDAVRDRILAIVAEKTGYPSDMLDLDLDLEADLGVDTVKQAEVFAAVRETYGIVRDDTIKLRDFPTLAHVIRFVHQRRPELAAAPPVAAPETKAPPPPPAPVADAADPVRQRIVDLVVEKTGYPQDMLDLDLDLEADLGIDTVKQAELFAAVRESYGIQRDDSLKLRDYPTLGHVIRFVRERRPDLPAPAAPAAPAVAGQPAPVASPVAAPSADFIRDQVLAIVAGKTGYPPDMLDLDLDLEADLGIDTVKQAEMFAAVRAAYNIPRDENLKLRDFPTLAHVIQFARERQAAGAPAAAEPTPAVEPPAAPSPAAAAPASFDAANQVPRRVPVAVLRPALEICKPTGVVLERGRRIVIMPDQGGVAEALKKQLKKGGAELLCLDPASEPAALAAQVEAWRAAAPVGGVYWLAALDPEPGLLSMDLPAWRAALRLRLKALYAVMRALYDQVGGPGTFLVSGTRLGGRHGYDPAGALAPLGGAVAGFTKTYKRERPDALVKVVDFGALAKPKDVADLLLGETLRDPGAVEVGHADGLRWTVTLQEQPAADGHPGLALGRDTVFVVSGAAGSIVSAITADLAAASGGIFYLLDLAPEPDPANPDLRRFVTDKDGLKRDLFARLQHSGQRATPAMIEKELAGLERQHAAHAAIEAVRAAGGAARYFSVNLTDADAVARVIAEVRSKHGRIDVLLHAAGMERSHMLPDKPPAEFDLVFDVKSDGWFNLLHAIGDMPLGATVAFSSIAGRFGNAGQADYSSANDLLCKMTSSFRTTRPATRGIAIDWTAWGGIGMATRGSIPKMMEVAGIDMLPPAAGVPLIRRELTLGGTRGEVLIGQRLGVLLNEWDSAGGLDGSALKPAPMIARAAAMTIQRGLTIETTLDPKLQPFLHDHQIDGTPVLPGVMGIEAFVEAAAFLLPGWRVDAVEDVRFLAPFKFYRHEPRPLWIEALLQADDGKLLATCRLLGRRALANQSEPQETTHFTARVRLAMGPAEPQAGKPLAAPSGHKIEAADIYRAYFHGPSYQVVARAWRDGNLVVGELAPGLPRDHYPPAPPLLLVPRLVELCFQTAGLWEMGVLGRMGLPQHIGQLRWFRSPDIARTKLYAVVVRDLERETFDAQVQDAAGAVYCALTGYSTIALPGAVDADKLKTVAEAFAEEHDLIPT